MNTTTLSRFEYSTTTTRPVPSFTPSALDAITTRFTEVLRVALVPQTPASVDIDDFINDLCAEDPRLDAAIEEGTRWVGRTFYAEAEESIKTLRLQAGMSQAKLAIQMATSQSYIAKLEAGDLDPGISSVAKLADALGQPREKVFALLINQYERRHG